MAEEKSLAWKAESPSFLEFRVSCIWFVHIWKDSCDTMKEHKSINIILHARSSSAKNLQKIGNTFFALLQNCLPLKCDDIGKTEPKPEDGIP